MPDYAHLSALAAVIRTGSFERAAQHLNVAPSAISQRIKLLEERLGVVLVVRGGNRGRPAPVPACRAGCPAGELLARELPGLLAESPPVTLRIAVNADILAIWFISAMAKPETAGWQGTVQV
jgi:LysR family transcriptional regulator (chromosome initiation inhibitor)